MVVNQVFGRFLPADRRLNPTALAWIVVVIAAIGMLAVQSSIAVGVYDAPVALAFGLTVIHAGTMPLSMLRPLFGAILSSFVCAVLPLIVAEVSVEPWPWMVPAMITEIFVIVVLGLRAHWGIALSALLGSIGGSSIAAAIGHFALDRTPSDAAIVNIMIYACIAGGVYVAAVIIQQWQLIRSQLLQEKENTAEEHSKRVTIEEKARIARELHDIVAHSMSIINIQASSAPVRHAELDVEVAKEFEDISTSARTALTEMRGLLSVLRSDDSTHELAPQPKLSDVDALVDKARQAGVRVSFERSGEAIGSALLDAHPDLEVIGQAEDGQECASMVADCEPDIVLMDVRMPTMDGIEATRTIVANSRSASATGPRIIMLTTFDIDDYVFDAFRAGASGFLLKDAPPNELAEAVRVVASGDSLLAPSVTKRVIEHFAATATPSRASSASALPDLTDREREILVFVARGESNSEIAARLVIAVQTVKTHVSRILYKLDARDRAQAVIAAYESGLVVPGTQG